MKNQESIFYDTHCHLMDLSQPNIISFLDQLRLNFSDEVLVNIFSPGYMFDLKNRSPLLKVMNLLNVMEHDPASMAELIDKDLKGEFLNNSARPFYHEGNYHLRQLSYDKWILIPLTIDFNLGNSQNYNVYYNKPNNKNSVTFAEKIYKAAKIFYEKDPKTKIRIHPFVGINPKAYSFDMFKEILQQYFSSYQGIRDNLFILGDKSFLRRKYFFAGIKLYPPLGFNPWPSEHSEKEKVNYLYEYCQLKNIPITVHCDDGGYRVMDARRSRRMTNPKAWESVFKSFPQLKVNFAHFGRQYEKKLLVLSQSEWSNTIISLMLKYPNVYSDVSYSGNDSQFYFHLKFLLDKQSNKDKEIIEKRLMFGSDFMINLNKVKSYDKYLRIFEDSVLSDELVHSMSAINPKNFLNSGY